MLDFHTHTFASDGVLLHSELIRRALAAGYRAIGITDHGDESNVEELVQKAKTAARSWGEEGLIEVIPGIEITHVPPDRIPEMANRARELGARIVVVHGETITEPVAPGTNSAAVMCPDVDILAHPGLLTRDDAAAAAENGVYLEITSRKGHSAANGRVARMALDTGAKLLISTDAHAPGDLITLTYARTFLAAAGLDNESIENTFRNAEELLKRTRSR
jgi:putative hydrolase